MSPKRFVLDTVIMAGLFFLIGFVTRIPAMLWLSVYGLHAILAALFYALVIGWYCNNRDSIGPVVVGAAIYGAILGLMSLTMLWAAIVPAVCALIIWIIGKSLSWDGTGFACAACFGAGAYPTVIISGFISGSLLLSVDEASIVFLRIVLGCLLSILGALFASYFALPGRRRGSVPEVGATRL